MMPLASFTEPFVINVPASPSISSSTVEFVAARRAMPLILTLLVNASSSAVDGENDR